MPCHVVSVTLGDRGVSPSNLTERELDPNRERLGSNSRTSIKETALPAHSTLQFHCVLSAKKQKKEAMAELTDQEMNDHMDEYEEVSVSKDNEV